MGRFKRSKSKPRLREGILIINTASNKKEIWFEDNFGPALTEKQIQELQEMMTKKKTNESSKFSKES